jgi:RNA polymerase sigma-B factor
VSNQTITELPTEPCVLLPRRVPAQTIDETSELAETIARSQAIRSLPREQRSGRVRFGAYASVPAVNPDIWELHVRYHSLRSRADREHLVEHYLALAHAAARRYYREREPFEDLLQVALEALVVAIDRFDPRRGVPFLGFARPTIVGSLKRHYRDTGWALRVPRRVHTLSGPVRDAQALLTQDLGRRPTVGEIADLLQLRPSEVDEVLDAVAARSTQSIDGAVDDRDVPMPAAADPDLARAEDRAVLQASIARLPLEDRELLHLYFDENMRQTDIAEMMGCSQMHISRSLRRVLLQLREVMSA